MKKVLFGYIMNGKAGGIDKYMLNFFEHFSPGEVHFDFLTTGKALEQGRGAF